MRRIKFVKNLGKKEGQGAGLEYDEGKTYEFEGPIPEGYAQAYIDRGYAVDVDAEAKAKQPVQRPAALNPSSWPQGQKADPPAKGSTSGPQVGDPSRK